MLTPEREKMQGAQCSAEKARCDLGKLPSETWCFICTVRGLGPVGSGDYSKGSREWTRLGVTPASSAGLYLHSPLWVPLLGCKMV